MNKDIYENGIWDVMSFKYFEHISDFYFEFYFLLLGIWNFHKTMLLKGDTEVEELKSNFRSDQLNLLYFIDLFMWNNKYVSLHIMNLEVSNSGHTRLNCFLDYLIQKEGIVYISGIAWCMVMKWTLYNCTY